MHARACNAVGVERFDVVVVGSRLAGCAVAAPLARAGRRVLVLDRMRFPSDQLSTHVLLPAGTSELAKLGALATDLALNPSRVRYVQVEVEGIVCRERLRPAADGIDFGVCVPRDLQDEQLVGGGARAGRGGPRAARPSTLCAGVPGAWPACDTATRRP